MKYFVFALLVASSQARKLNQQPSDGQFVQFLKDPTDENEMTEVSKESAKTVEHSIEEQNYLNIDETVKLNARNE